jgi:hypothetical protein
MGARAHICGLICRSMIFRVSKCIRSTGEIDDWMSSGAYVEILLIFYNQLFLYTVTELQVI